MSHARTVRARPVALVAALATIGATLAPAMAAPARKPAPAAPIDPYGAPAAAPAPVDPYGPAPNPAPTPAPAPPPGDTPAPVDPYAPVPPAPEVDTATAELDAAVAAALVARAHHLLDVREWADAKQLAVEALMRSPGGPSAADAQEIIRIANQRLGIVDPPPPTPGNPAPTDPITDPVGPIPPPATGPVDAAPHARGRVVLTGYGAASGAVIGLGFGGAAGSNGGEAAGAILGGLAGGALGYWVGGKRHTSVASARTLGVGATWGGIALAFMADAVGGSNQPTTHHDVFIGAALGTGIGAAGGLWLARTHPLTADGATIVDSFGGLGVAGGLAIGELMQPYANEAYSLNAALGAAGGALVGLYVASNHEISSRRMARVDGIAALGGAAPWLLYAAIQTNTSNADERICGLLSAGGLVAGLWLGFRVTRKLDQPRVAPTAPTVEVGALGIRPASTPLAPSVGRGMIVDLARATW